MIFYFKGDSRTVCKPKAANCLDWACVEENDAINEQGEMTDDLDVVNRERRFYTFIVVHVLFHCSINSGLASVGRNGDSWFVEWWLYMKTRLKPTMQDLNHTVLDCLGVTDVAL